MRHTLFSAVRTTLMSGLLAISIPAFANTNELYQVSGMQTHQEHFQQALKKAQQRYAAQLPASVAENLKNKSNERFESGRMHARAAATLQVNLNDSELEQALTFYRSDLGQQVVTAETRATSPAEVSAMQNGLPVMQASAERKATIDRLAKQLPALDMGEEVSNGASRHGDSERQANARWAVPDSRRAGHAATRRIRSQLEPKFAQTLLYVYRDLVDAQVHKYANWSESGHWRTFIKPERVALRIDPDQ